MYFDRFDICEAYYCFGVLYNGPMGCGFNDTLCRLEGIQFQPSLSVERKLEAGLTENGRAIFDKLVAKREELEAM